MKKIKLAGIAFIAILMATLLFTACKKNDKLSAEEIQQIQITSEADAEADVLFNDVFDNVVGVNEEIGIGTGIGVFGRTASTQFTEVSRTDSAGQRCFNVTITPLAAGVFPKTVVLDFGTGCLGPDGRTRKGKISTLYTGRMIIPGNKATTTFDNYYVDSIKVEGTHIIQNNSTSNNRVFNVQVQNGKLIRPSGNYTAWDKNRTWTQTEGNGTPNFPADDEFSITGIANGSVKRGANLSTWSAEIIQPIIRRFTCRWPIKGQTRITRNSVVSVLDYGNGTCDNQATVTINGNVYNITLR